VAHSRLHGQEVVFSVLIRVRPVVAEATVDRNIHTTQRVHDADQAIEVGADVMVHPDAQVVE
jgi:hypothetical protein